MASHQPVLNINAGGLKWEMDVQGSLFFSMHWLDLRVSFQGPNSQKGLAKDQRKIK